MNAVNANAFNLNGLVLRFGLASKVRLSSKFGLVSIFCASLLAPSLGAATPAVGDAAPALQLRDVYGKNVKSEWKTVTSPYLLADQTLESRVVVRAIDNAGNIQEKILGPTNGDLSLPKNSTISGSAGVIGAWCVVAALTGILMGGILLFIQRRTRRNSGDASEGSTHAEEVTEVTKEGGGAE